ncbi:MAG: DUF2802 domain-containing protein [Acidobacteriia bacterium]|nr:DUF2802 domain-containing protein [Terriglobia bacterium]
MNWLDGFLCLLSAAALLSAGGYYLLQRHWRRRFQALSEEVARVSEDLAQVVELQADIYRRLCRDLNDVEEKVLDLSVPSSDVPPPLERRHQVLTLARKGVAVDEIARRLNMPRGEAELILSLRKYVDAKTPTEPAHGVLRGYARA